MSKTVTKSIRMTPAESAELTRLSERTALSEAALMKKWIQEGMRAQKLDLAIQAYMQGNLDLRGGAAMAGISYNRFLRELQARNVVVLDDDRFLERLGNLAAAFEDGDLQTAVQAVREYQEPTPSAPPSVETSA